MPRSLKREVCDVGELIAEVGLTRHNLVAITMTPLNPPEIHVEAFELARIYRLLDVPSSKIAFRTSNAGDIHISFKARGVQWVTCVLHSRREEFERLLHDKVPGLTAWRRRLARPPVRLTLKEVS